MLGAHRGVGAAAAKAGNNDNAHACQQGGGAGLFDEDQSPFKNPGDCASHGAKGGPYTGLAPIALGGGAADHVEAFPKPERMEGPIDDAGRTHHGQPPALTVEPALESEQMVHSGGVHEPDLAQIDHRATIAVVGQALQLARQGDVRRNVDLAADNHHIGSLARYHTDA